MKRNLQVAAFTLATAMFACLGAKAQSPGGVAPAVWYRADAAALYANAGTTPATNNGTVQQWNDAQGSGRNLIQNTASARPVFSSETTLSNFNPTVTFDGSNDFLQFTAGAGVNLINRANGSIFTAGRVNTLKQSGFAGFHASMDFPGLHVFGSNRKLLFFTGGPGYQGLSADAFAANTSFSAGSGWQNGSGSSASATVSFNGIRTDYTGSELRNVIVNDAYRDFRIGGDSNYGSFSGQLNEVLVYEDRLNADQMDRVETYLAIKYGTTYAKGTRDYKNAAGDVVWSASVNAGFGNNIAGIAVDNNGALSQKQSWSTNAGQQVLIGVGTLSATNAANGGTIANNQYLVWGDNGGAKVPTVATSAFAGVSHHFQSIWKVQNTGIGTVRVAWPKGFKGLSLVQSSDATIGAGDVITPMSGEATLNGMVYNYADVTLASGQYFTIAAKVPAPGGVTTGLTQWYRADQNLGSTGGNGTNITSWTDYTRGTVSGPISSAPVPVYKEGATNHFNFNPGVQFTSNRQMLGNISAQTLESTSFDIFTFTKEGLTGTRFFNVGRNNTTLNGTNWDSPGLNANGSVGTRDLNGGAGGTLNPGSVAFSATTPSIMYHTFTNTSIRKGLNGAALGTAWNVSARGQQTGGHIFGSNAGTNPPNGDDYGFVGHIGEVIVYGAGNLSATDRNKVDSYLALKYGITLPATVNYLDSDGDIVWNSSSNSTFHKNVAGIVHDEASALNQKQSISVNKGQQVLISTPGLANTNAANGTALADGQYVIWGDNGLSKSLTTSHNTIVSGNELNLRFAAVWKVANTGSAGVVRVAWPTGIVNLHLIQSNDATIDISDAHTRMNNTVSVNGVTYNYADVSLADGSYFSFGGFIAGPGGVGQDLSLWYRADSGVEADASNKVTGWNNSTAKDVKLQMSSASAYIPYNDQITKAWNFNPTLSFDGTNNYLRNTTTDYLTAGGAVHYITVARLTASASSYNSIFAISGNDDGFFLYPQSGLVYPMPAIGNGFGAAAAGPGSANRFGIYSAILPKTGTPANQRGFYNGLEKVYTAPYPLTGGWYSLPTRGAYIGADGTTGDNPKGDIAEVIVYHEPAGGDMTNANLAKIHSYLAVKYGVTLDQTTPQNYVNSGGNVVWNATTNIGYKNNIAGIARDDQGGLYQKQSGSVNPGAQVVIGTTGLANTNGSNAEPLSNGQFLIWGDNGLAKAPGVSFGTIAGLPYNRFAAIWKVENTSSVETVRVAWVKGYANLKLVQSPDATIDLSDAVTEMSSTITIGGKEYAYADVTLQNGTYFTFAAVVQGPGGVTTNLSQWYRADYYVESEGDGEDASSWADFNGGVVSTQLGEANLPTAKKGAFDYFNFNPGINFTGADQKLGNISLPTLSALNFDIFSVTKEGMSGTRFFNIGMDNTTFNGNNWDQPGLYANGNIARRTNTGSNAIIVNPGNVNFSTNTPSIMYHAFTDLSMSKGLNGAVLPSSPYTHTARGAVTGGHFFGSNSGSGTSGDDGGFTGSIGELIIYGAG
ncbi:MAG TPA: hypothetical protein VGN64_23255, partial [Dyadobacter sp.]|nr:hypothetical protein [Dyadobacter sp.]